MIGQVLLGKYRVSRRIDEGGMSLIYLARQADQNRDVVVKVLKDAIRTQAKAVEHFRREIHIMTKFRHANSVEVYDADTKDPRGPFLFMEYLRGIDLNQLAQREKKFSPDRVGRMLVQMCDGLQAAHDAGVVHRDLKPGNLMMLYPGTPQETLKLMDFGLAKMSSMLYISPEEVFDWTLPAAAGTPEYISPEMVRGNDMDARGDLYSVGVILYEMLTGRRPFLDTDITELMLAHANRRPPSFAESGAAGIDPAIEAVVMSCLGKYPEERPKSAWDLALAYEKALGRRITVGRERGGAPAPASGSHSGATATPAAAPANPASNGPRSAERSVVRTTIEANMPEVMALMKLKGFVGDLGGEIVESVPGLIKVRLQEKSQGGGLFGWMTGKASSALKTASGTDIELHMERRDPSQSSKLTITLVMRPAGGMQTLEWRDRANRISRDLQAYLR